MQKLITIISMILLTSCSTIDPNLVQAAATTNDLLQQSATPGFNLIGAYSNWLISLFNN